MTTARPSPIRLRPDIGAVYREKLARLREALATKDDPAALETARTLIERVIIHPAANRATPDITVEGHLASMLAIAQPDLAMSAAVNVGAKMSAALSVGISSPP